MSVFSDSGSEGAWLIRSDFSDRAAWEAVCQAAAAAYSPDVQRAAADIFKVVDDPEFEDLTPEGLIALHPFLYATYFLVDRFSMTNPEQPLLAVDVLDELGRSFRLIPSEIPSFADNMLISNMDFADFADGVGEDGIFRGFGSPSQTAAPLQTPAEPAPAPDDLAAPATQADADTVRGESTFAATIELSFGQRWVGDTKRVSQSDIPMMKWEEPES